MTLDDSRGTPMKPQNMRFARTASVDREAARWI